MKIVAGAYIKEIETNQTCQIDYFNPTHCSLPPACAV